MKGNKVFWFLVMLLILAIGLMLLPSKVGAEDGYPKGVQVFQVEGVTYVLYDGDNDDILKRVCPCYNDCVVKEVQNYNEDVVKTPDKPDPTPTDKPNPTPEPTKKPKCNSGRGNGSEGQPDCDPGNSGGHNQGGD